MIPTTEGGGFAGLTASATELLDKVRTIPFDAIGKNLNGILKSVNDATKGPQLKNAVASLQTIMASAQDMVKQLDRNMGPASKQLPEISAELQKTLTSANKLIVSLDNGYGDNTKFNRDLERLMVQVTDAARAIRALADLLARHPEALIKGRPAGAHRMTRLEASPPRWLSGCWPSRSPPAPRPTGALHDRAGSGAERRPARRR